LTRWCRAESIARDAMADIFLSYARKDQTVAAALVEQIEETGKQVWWDKSEHDQAGIEPGSDFEVAIRQALAEASDCVVLLSASSLRSDWVKSEAYRARNSKMRMIFVKISNFDDSEAWLWLDTHQIIDLSNWDSTSPPHALLDVWKKGAGKAPFIQSLLERSRRLLPLALPFVALVFLLNAIGVFELLGVDTRLSFVMLSARGMTSARHIDPRLVLVVIDDATDAVTAPNTDFDRWRAFHATALRQLSKASVVAYDITFEPKPSTLGGTSALADAIRSVRAGGTSVVIGAQTVAKGDLVVAPELRSALAVPLADPRGVGVLGHVCIGVGAQLVTSSVPLLAKRDSGSPLVSLALAAFAPSATVVAKSDSDTQISLVTNEDQPLAIAGYEPTVGQSHCAALTDTTPVRYYLDVFPYDIRRTALSVIPFEALLQPSFDVNRVAGKIVLVGSWRSRDTDQRWVWDHGPYLTPGMNVQAAAINTLLSKTFIRPVGPGLQLGWLLALALLGALIRDKVPPSKPLARAGLLLLLIALDMGAATALSLLGLLSEIPYHLVVIGLSYSYSQRSLWRWRELRSWFAREPVAAPKEVGG
jgi:hypothetical protein